MPLHAYLIAKVQHTAAPRRPCSLCIPTRHNMSISPARSPSSASLPNAQTPSAPGESSLFAFLPSAALSLSSHTHSLVFITVTNLLFLQSVARRRSSSRVSSHVATVLVRKVTSFGAGNSSHTHDGECECSVQGDSGGLAVGLGLFRFGMFHTVAAHQPGELPVPKSTQPCCQTTNITQYSLCSSASLCKRGFELFHPAPFPTAQQRSRSGYILTQGEFLRSSREAVFPYNGIPCELES